MIAALGLVVGIIVFKELRSILWQYVGDTAAKFGSTVDEVLCALSSEVI